MLVWFGLLIYVYLIGFIGPVNGDLGVACPGTPCVPGNHEICDTDNTNNCICEAGYTAGTADATTCFQDCPADPGFAHGTQTGDLHFEGTASITCDPGYTAGAGGGGGSITCQNDGTWDTTGAVACTAVDCSTTISDANGAHSGDSTYGGTASINCNVGYTGGGSIICKADGSWDEAGATTCAIVDCGNRPSEDGYVPEASPASTLQGATVSVTCAEGYTGTAAQITCEASGSWSTYSGCSGGNRTKLDFSLIIVLAVLMLVLI